jgi:hypothetical protein
MISADAAAAIPALWATRILGYLPQYLTVSRAVTNINDYVDSEFKRIGDTIHLPSVDSVSIGDKSENENYTFQELVLGDQTLVLNKHKYAAFGTEKRALSLVNQDVVTPHLQEAAQKLAEQVDSDIFALYSSIAVGNTVTSSSVLARADIIAAREILKKARVTPNEELYGVIDFGSEATLLADTNLTQWLALGQIGNIANAKIGGPSSVFPSSIGRAYGVDLAASGLVPTTTVSGVTTAHNLVFAKDAIVWACRPMYAAPAGMGALTATQTDPASGLSVSVTMFYDGNAGALKVTAEILYGIAFLRQSHAVLINSTTS